VLGCAALIVFIGLLLPANSAPPEQPAAQPGQPSPADLAEMMERARKFTAPGPQHEALARFLGKWDTETRFFMGDQPGAAEKGTAEHTWLMEGRWLQCDSQGTLLGQPSRTHVIMGYDNFKMSYVMTIVSNMDTSMLRAEGDFDPDGKALISYGTLDEYLTGEHDKMVKYVWRLVDDDKMVLEIHDLPIGETNTKVLEISYTRRSE
jgi:hypothetical protein